MDEELAALAEALETAQAAETQRELSERNVVELVLKLREQKKLELVFSLSGNEFVTPERLRQEICQEVKLRGGRARLDEMAATLDLDLTIVESAAQSLVRNEEEAKSDDIAGPALSHQVGVAKLSFLTALEIVSSDFRNTLCREIDELLVNGLNSITLGALATNHAVPVEFARQTVEHGIANGIIRNARLQGNVLRTDAYEAALSRKVLGALLAITQPTSLSQIAKAAEIEMSELESVFLRPKVAENMIDLQKLGSVRNGDFVPACFAARQRRAVDDYFSQNHCLPRNVMRSFHLTSGTALGFVRVTFPKAQELSSCIISSTTLEALDASVSEAISNKAWLDVAAQGLIPTQVSDADFINLLEKCDGSARRVKILGQRVVISRSLLDAIQSHLETIARDAHTLHAESSKGKRSTEEESIEDLVGSEFPQLQRASDVLALVCTEVKPYYKNALARAKAEANSSVILHGAAALLQRQSQIEATFAELYADIQMFVKAASRLGALGLSPTATADLDCFIISRFAMPLVGLMVEHQCIQHGEPLEGNEITRVRSSVGTASLGNVLFNPAWKSAEICWAAAQDKLPERCSVRTALLAALSECEEASRDSNHKHTVQGGKVEGVGDCRRVSAEALNSTRVLQSIETAGRECCFVVRAIDKKAERARMQARRTHLLEQAVKTTSETFLGACVSVLVLQQCKQLALPIPQSPLDKSEEAIFASLIEPACVCLDQSPARQDDLRELVSGGPVDDALFQRIHAFASLKNPSKGK